MISDLEAGAIGKQNEINKTAAWDRRRRRRCCRRHRRRRRATFVVYSDVSCNFMCLRTAIRVNIFGTRKCRISRI